MMSTARKLLEALGHPRGQPQDPGDSDRMGGYPQNDAGDSVNPGVENDLGDELDHEGTYTPEEEMAVTLGGHLEEDGCRVQTFEDAGIMTRNIGLVVRHPKLGKFQVIVVQDRRG